jgi:hypothetical protein
LDRMSDRSTPNASASASTCSGVRRSRGPLMSERCTLLHPPATRLCA